MTRPAWPPRQEQTLAGGSFPFNSLSYGPLRRSPLVAGSTAPPLMCPVLAPLPARSGALIAGRSEPGACSWKSVFDSTMDDQLDQGFQSGTQS